MSRGGIIIDPNSPGDPRRGTPSQAGPRMEQTESGLVVPEGTKAKIRHVVLNDDWKQWRRTIKGAEKAELAVMFVCLKCQTPVRPREDRKELFCSCSRWELPGFEGPDAPKEETDGKA